jgi:protein-tyrosine phosphatase
VVRAESATRFISLDGAQNFRDVGGYRTASGRMVKRGRLYRSGTLGGLTPAGQARFNSLHSVAIIDLRNTSERTSDQVAAWLKSRRGYWTRDYGRSQGDLGRTLGDTSGFTTARMRAMMTGAYRRMYKEQAPAFRVLFTQLLSAHGAVVVNCTAGKDRTGIAIALVLTALGVPYATVREDFLLSNAGIDPARLAGTLNGPFAKLPPDVVAPMLGVDGEYLDAAFDQIRKDHGSIEAFLEQELGVGPSEIAQLRRRMLT